MAIKLKQIGSDLFIAYMDVNSGRLLNYSQEVEVSPAVLPYIGSLDKIKNRFGNLEYSWDSIALPMPNTLPPLTNEQKLEIKKYIKAFLGDNKNDKENKRTKRINKSNRKSKSKGKEICSGVSDGKSQE